MSDDEPRSTAPITAIALAAGVIGAVQPKINGVLAERVDSSLLASLVNFAAAFTGVVVMLGVRRQTRKRLRDIRSWPVPRWTFLAGLGGATVVMIGAVTVQTIGVAVYSVAFFAGQLATGLAVDRLGVGAGGVRPIAPARVQAAVLAVGAVAISQLGRPVGELAPLLVLLVVVSGAASAFQSAFNGRIAAAVGDPFAPTAVNVTLGFTALGLVVVVGSATGSIDGPSWPAEPWLYAGGFIGVTIVLSLAITSAALGVFRSTVAMLAAQLTAAFVVDWLVEDRPPTPGVLAGAALILLAVVLVGRPIRRSLPTGR